MLNFYYLLLRTGINFLQGTLNSLQNLSISMYKFTDTYMFNCVARCLRLYELLCVQYLHHNTILNTWNIHNMYRNWWNCQVNLYFHGSSALVGLGPSCWGFEIALGRTPLDEWSARRRDRYRTTRNTSNRQISMPPAGFETLNPSKWAAGDPHLRPRSHWDLQSFFLYAHKYWYTLEGKMLFWWEISYAA